MTLLYFLNLIIYVFLECYCPVYLSKKMGLGIVSPITIVAYSTLPIILFKAFIGPAFLLNDGLFNKYYNYAILMTSIALLGKFFLIKYSILFFKRYKITRSIANSFSPHWHIAPKRLFIAATILLLMGFFCFLLVATHSYGVINWILDPRTGYQLHRTGAGQFFALAILFYSIAFTIFTIYIKKDINVLFCILGFIISVYFLGTKDVILSFGITGIVILWFRKSKYFYKTLYFGIPAIFLLMLLNFGSANLEEVASYFDYYTNSAMYYEEYFNGGINLFHGELFLTSFWEVVPRALYPEKPFVYGFLIVNEHFFPGMAEATNTPAFGGPVGAFADWGIIGVLTSSFLDYHFVFELFLYYYLFKNCNLEHIKKSPFLLYCLIILFAPAFMKYIGFPLNLILWIFIVKIISISNRIIIRFNHATT